MNYSVKVLHPNGNQYAFVGNYETLAEVETKLAEMKKHYEGLGFFGHSIKVMIDTYICTAQKEKK